MLGKAVNKRVSEHILPFSSPCPYRKREGLCPSVGVSLPTVLIFPAKGFLTEKNGFSPHHPQEKVQVLPTVFHPRVAAAKHTGSSSSLLLHYNTPHEKQREQTKQLHPLLHKPCIWYHLHLLNKSENKNCVQELGQVN